MRRRVKVHRRESHNADEDGSKDLRNTLRAETQQVRIFYPFHPLHGLSLQVIVKPQRGDGAVCVKDPTGKRLKIPAWMLTPDASHMRIAEQAHLSEEALLSLTSLIAPMLDITNHNLPQTVVDRCNGGQRVQLQFLDLTTLKECVRVPVEARSELIALMARILVAVYQAEGGRVHDGAFVQPRSSRST